MRYEPTRTPQISNNEDWRTIVQNAYRWLADEFRRISDGAIELFSVADYTAIGHVNSNGSLPDSYYIAGFNNGTALTVGVPSANVLRAIPFIAPGRGSKLSQLAFNVTVLGVGSARIGIYNSKSKYDIYPDKLLDQSADISITSIGVKTYASTVQLQPGALYWLAMVSDGTPTLRCGDLSGSEVPKIIPHAAALGTTPSLGLSVAYPYAALPTTFPASAAFITALPVPALAYRFGA